MAMTCLTLTHAYDESFDEQLGRQALSKPLTDISLTHADFFMNT